MPKALVIVESPAKAKTINKYLGKQYIVKASLGHIKDLPKKDLAVDVEHGFTPRYEIIEGKRKLINELKQVAKTVEAIYLMCFSAASYRSRINRRLMISKDRTDRESVLIELRRERGLTAGGDYRLNLVALNRLILQSGLTIGFGRLIVGGVFRGRAGAVVVAVGFLDR